MKRILFAIPVIILISAFMYASGYRVTAEGAVKAHSFLENGATLVKKLDSSIGDIYIYKQKDYYLTIIPESKGLLWRAPSNCTTQYINDKADKVRTIGWASSSYADKSGTTIVVEVKDSNVAYIEAGPEFQRIRKEVRKGEFVVFSWNKPYFSHNIKPTALSKTGKELYRYGYPQNTSFLDGKELRWHKTG